MTHHAKAYDPLSGLEDTAADTSWSPSDQWVRLWDHAVLLPNLLWNAAKWFVPQPSIFFVFYLYSFLRFDYFCRSFTSNLLFLFPCAHRATQKISWTHPCWYGAATVFQVNRHNKLVFGSALQICCGKMHFMSMGAIDMKCISNNNYVFIVGAVIIQFWLSIHILPFVIMLNDVWGSLYK